MSLIMPSTFILMFFGMSAATCTQDLTGTDTTCTSMETLPDETSLLQLGSHYAQGERRGVSAGHAAPSPGPESDKVYSRPVAVKVKAAKGDMTLEEMEAMVDEWMKETPTYVAPEQVDMRSSKAVKVKALSGDKGQVSDERVVEAVKVKALSGDKGEVSDEMVVEAGEMLLPIKKDGSWLDQKWGTSITHDSAPLVVDPGSPNREYLYLDNSEGTFYDTTTSGVSLKLKYATKKTHEMGADVLLLQKPYGELIRSFRKESPSGDGREWFVLMLDDIHGSSQSEWEKMYKGKTFTWKGLEDEAPPGQEYYVSVDQVGTHKNMFPLLFVHETAVETYGNDFYKEYGRSPVRPIVTDANQPGPVQLGRL